MGRQHNLIATPARHVPELSSGLTVLRQHEPRAAGIHHLALGSLPQQGISFWVDAASMASTYRLYELAPSDRWLSGLRIARGFTAYQHVSLVREVLRRSARRTPAMLVFPSVASLYRDDDIPDYDRDALFTAVVDGLAGLADSTDIPILVSVAGDDGRVESVVAAADHVLACEQTEFGHRFVGDGIETMMYWDEGAWQTTIPYWVEVCGAVGEMAALETAESFGIEGVA